MHDEESDVSGLVFPCGHRNPPSARFCDVCGIRLPRQCPRCHATNRSHANFCSNCGVVLGDVVSPHAIAPIGPAPTGPPEPPTSQVVDVVEVEDAERLEHIKRFFQGDRGPRRAWLPTALVSVASVIGILVLAIVGAALVRTYTVTRSAESPSLIDADAPATIGSRAEEGPSAAVGGSTPPGGSRPDTSARADGQDGAPVTAPDTAAAGAPSSPRAGGELIFVVPGEPPSYDAHREETFALIHPAAPHYNTLLRIDPLDRTGTRVVGDLATSWTVSPDRRTYVLKLRRGVKFHDGTEMTSRDVRATYEKIINPPPGIRSARKGEYLQVETVQAPEPYIVAFKLRWPSPSFIHSLASPWNWIYKADILERDVRWYETNIMGTGPFVFVEHVKGSRWVGRRNADYWDRGKPYLNGYQALFIRDDAAQAAAISSGRAHIQFRGFSPAQRDDIVRALGSKATVQTGPWNCGLVIAVNHEKAPFSDPRVRRALSLALDRHSAAATLSKNAIVRDVAGVQVPGSPFATPPTELIKLAGYSRDIRESRSEARRLLAEAGVPDGFSFALKNRDIPMPYQPIGAWLVDEWRRIGLKARHEIQDSAQYFKDLRGGNFDLSTDFQCGYVVDPDLDLYKFQSQGRSDANYGRYTDPVLDDLYVRQSRTVNPELRRRYIRAFEKRLLDEEAHYIYTLQWHRIVPHSARVRGWTITPSHYLNNQLDTVWLSE
jgi:peptide/nickel transport system substrate-binding protein